jgi:LasA protease
MSPQGCDKMPETWPVVYDSMKNFLRRNQIKILVLISFLFTACAPTIPTQLITAETPSSTQDAQEIKPTSMPTRPKYQPGELVDYVAQDGDTLPALAAHFNTTVDEIRQANPVIPNDVTTLPPGFPMKIPIYYQSLWGSSFQILPDSLFINGPAQVGFDTVQYVQNTPGWLKNFVAYTGEGTLVGGQIVEHVATNFSISPRLLLALLEYQAGALSQPTSPGDDDPYPLGFVDITHQGVYAQLVLAANILNNGYYGWRTGTLITLELADGRMEVPDPWQNAASIALQYYFGKVYLQEDYEDAIHGQGLLKTYTDLFGDPWQGDQPHIPGSLQQPEMLFPFAKNKVWAYTGGPHTGWGDGLPYAAIDFAPPSVSGGCTPSDEWVTAVADGMVVRAEPAMLVLDLDKDGNEQTGWVVFYLHLATEDMVKVGSILEAGQPIGHPSCEGGEATGTHIHIARKYNGEWISAGGPLAFNLEGWLAREGGLAYQGFLQKFGNTIQACVCSDQGSQIQVDMRK